ncbi:MAG: hypothetical protein CMJ25_21235 [Phycisphaerae bacterium]|nr:hypothetical protein [Phycisphaerae bacterium]
MIFKIEKNVAIPAPLEERQTKYSHLKVQAQLMEIGDSIWVNNSHAVIRLRDFISKAIPHYENFLVISHRESNASSRNGYRVWLINKEWALNTNSHLSKLHRSKLNFTKEENDAYFKRVHNLDDQGNPK